MSRPRTIHPFRRAPSLIPKLRPLGSPHGARAAGYDVRAVDYEIGRVAGAWVRADGYAGTVRMVVDEERKVILGMNFVGPDVSELLQAATIAVTAQVPWAGSGTPFLPTRPSAKSGSGSSRPTAAIMASLQTRD